MRDSVIENTALASCIFSQPGEQSHSPGGASSREIPSDSRCILYGGKAEMAARNQFARSKQRAKLDFEQQPSGDY